MKKDLVEEFKQRFLCVVNILRENPMFVVTLVVAAIASGLIQTAIDFAIYGLFPFGYQFVLIMKMVTLFVFWFSFWVICGKDVLKEIRERMKKI